MAIGKTAPNGTLNADGAFYSVQDVNVLLENAGGGGGGGADLPTPTVADAGSVVVVDNEGKYALGEAGGGGLIVNVVYNDADDTSELDKSYNEIKTALLNGDNITVLQAGDSPMGYNASVYLVEHIYANASETECGLKLYSIAYTDGSWGIIVYDYSATSADGVLTLVTPGD